MKKIFVKGTLGDAFTANLKLMNEKDIEIFHYTIHKVFYKQILEIYSLFKNIKNVTFIEFTYPDTREITGIPEEGMCWFPELKLDYVPIKEKYIVIAPHAGREDAMARKIPLEIVEKMVKLLQPIPVVLVGTDKQYKDIKCEMNLIGETTLTEMTSVVINSSGFAGPEGYSCFVALSHRIPSVIFYVREQPVMARLLNNEWTEFIIDLIKIRS